MMNNFMSKFDKFLVVGLVFVVLIIAVSATFDNTLPYHLLQQISGDGSASVDVGGDGLIDQANFAQNSDKILCNGDYNSIENCLTDPVVTGSNPGVIGGSSGVPSGVILMWSGAIVDMPSGWKLCDGTNSTPDLSGQFIVGYDSTNVDYDVVGKTGGQNSVALTTQQLASHAHTMTGSTQSAGSHTHSGSTNTTGNHSHSTNVRSGYQAGDSGSMFNAYNLTSGFFNTSSNGNHSHTLSINSAGSHTHVINASIGASGSGQAHENRPSFYTLAFIMKE